jgi:hypothetical protein
MPDQRPVWRFPGRDPRAVLESLAAAGVGPAALGALGAPGSVVVEEDKVSLLPGVDLLVGLSPGVRSAVYALLAGNGLNPHHERPQIVHGDVDEWLRGCALSARQLALFRSLLWRRDTAVLFSDVSALMAAAASAVEIEEARRVLTRVRTLRVTVIRPGPEDEGRFLDYWSAGGRNRTSAPLLNSTFEEAPGKGIDLSLLLPPLARERLYTFPSLQDAVAGRLPDCNWTSLNFFALRPRAYYLDGRTSYLALTEEYEEVPRADRFRDLIAFVSTDGLVLHTCVHVADDIVFTKNGQLLFAPWLLQRRADVAAIYGREGRTLKFFRLKPGHG